MRTWHKRHLWILLLGLLLVCIVVPTTWRILRTTQHEAEVLVFRNWDHEVKVVGDAACAECHASIFSMFKRSEMGNSFHVPTPEQVNRDGWENSTTYEPNRNFYYRAFVDQGHVFQEEYRLNEEDRKIHSLIREARYAIGSGAHGRSFVTESNGYLTAMAIGRYQDAGTWDLSPGYKDFNLRFERPIPEECMACHAGGSSYVAGSGNRYRLPLDQGIRCENCHGPGELHVRERRRTPLAGPEIDDTIVNPARLDFTRQNDVCLGCHLIPDAQFPRKGKSAQDYRPGMLLRDFREDFLVQTPDTDKFGFASHGPRTAQSRCWTEGDSAGQLTCISCHQPHSPLSEVPPQHYVNRCLSCHDQIDCKRPDRNAGEDNCAACHMQRSKVTNIPHVVFTDHWIRARPQPAAGSNTSGVEGIASSKGNRRVNLVSFWPRDRSERGRSRSWAIAQIKYFDMHPQNRSVPDLLEAADVLQRIKSDPKDSERWFVLGVAQFHLDNMSAAAQSYQRAAECPEGYEKAFTHAGDAYETIGMFEQAKQMYEKSISQWPDFVLPYERLAALHVREGQFSNALELLRKEIDLNPDRATAWNQLGMTYYLHDQDIEMASEAIQKALDLNPDLLEGYVSLGFMCSREGRHQDAIQAYEGALRISPQHMESLLGAASLYEQVGNLSRATELLERAAKAAPGELELGRRLSGLRSRSR